MVLRLGFRLDASAVKFSPWTRLSNAPNFQSSFLSCRFAKQDFAAPLASNYHLVASPARVTAYFSSNRAPCHGYVERRVTEDWTRPAESLALGRVMRELT